MHFVRKMERNLFSSHIRGLIIILINLMQVQKYSLNVNNYNYPLADQMKNLLLILVLAVMCSSVAKADDFDDGVEAANKGDF